MRPHPVEAAIACRGSQPLGDAVQEAGFTLWYWGEPSADAQVGVEFGRHERGQAYSLYTQPEWARRIARAAAAHGEVLLLLADGEHVTVERVCRDGSEVVRRAPGQVFEVLAEEIGPQTSSNWENHVVPRE